MLSRRGDVNSQEASVTYMHNLHDITDVSKINSTLTFGFTQDTDTGLLGESPGISFLTHLPTLP